MVSLSPTLEESGGVSGATPGSAFLPSPVALLPWPRTVSCPDLNTYRSEHKTRRQVHYISAPEPRSECRISSEPRSEHPISPEPICEICLEVLDLSSPTPRCTHGPMICAPCLGEYITHAIKVEGSTRLVCPAVQCREELGYEVVIGRIEGDAECLDRYNTLRARRELERNPNFMWCPNPECGQGQVHAPEGPIVTCNHCNTQACFSHRVLWHEGFTCEEYTIDREILPNEEYFKRHTKRCPSQICGLQIEKDSGCDHMTCICGYEFCWDCLADWVLAPGNHTHNPGCRYYMATPPTRRRRRRVITRIPRTVINRVQGTIDAQIQKYRAARVRNDNLRAQASHCACGCRPIPGTWRRTMVKRLRAALVCLVPEPRSLCACGCRPAPGVRRRAIVKRLAAPLVRLVSAVPWFPSRTT